MSGQLALLVRAQFHCSVMRLANKQIVPTCVSVVKDVTNFELPCRMALLATAQTNCRSHNRMPIFFQAFGNLLSRQDGVDGCGNLDLYGHILIDGWVMKMISAVAHTSSLG